MMHGNSNIKFIYAKQAKEIYQYNNTKRSAEAIDLGRPYWILHPVPCHTPEAATTVSKCS